MKSFIYIILIASIIISPGCESKKEETQYRNLPPELTLYPPEQQKLIQKQANIDPKVADEIIGVIMENLEATRAEDIDRVLATVHTESLQYSSTVQGLEFVFANFDLEFQVEKVEVIEVLENDAKVYYVLTTRSIRGQGFTNKRDEGIHNLKKQDGEWKIFKTENISTVPVE